MTHETDVHERYVAEAPKPQHLIDLLPGWISALPATVPVHAGTLPLFEDPRVTWALAELSGVSNELVLELGPLEAGHTFMLHQAGAASITSIEANSLAFLRCLVVKELLHLDRTRFLLGDFVQWMATERTRFDVVFASGVLYHMPKPLEFLSLVADKADKLFLWTHFVPDEGYPENAVYASAIVGVEEVEHRGRKYHLHRRRYGAPTGNPEFCGGIYGNPAWLPRGEILEALRSHGFSDLRIGFEDPAHQNGPCFCVVALR